MSVDAKTLETLFLPKTIRAQAQRIYNAALAGATHFEIHEDKLEATADYVLEIIQQNYPSLEVPYHSRWRHYEVGNRFQLNNYFATTESFFPIEKAKTGLDLIIPSVLVDAGAGEHWKYKSSNTVTIGRSEGLGLASMDAFLAGAFSDPSPQTGRPNTCAAGLKALTSTAFKEFFQVSDENPLAGVEGRLTLLWNLAETLENKPEFFPNQRPGDLVDYLLNTYGDEIHAVDVLTTVLQALGDLWPGRLTLNDRNLGDTWAYQPFGEGFDALIPFHKLSQWITYSVIETLEMSEITVTHVEQLTGLAEYRNGGLMLDSGLISLRNPALAENMWLPASEIIIEWRALTIHLLDKLAALICQKLGKTEEEFPLAKVLEGGTWAAGRALAKLRDANMNPPLNIVSDGTVF